MRIIMGLFIVLSLALSGCSVTDKATETSTEETSIMTTVKEQDVTLDKDNKSDKQQEKDVPVVIEDNGLTKALTILFLDGEKQYGYLDIENLTHEKALGHYVKAELYDIATKVAVVKKTDVSGDIYTAINQDGKAVEPTHQYTYLVTLEQGLFAGLSTSMEHVIFDSEGTIYGTAQVSMASEQEKILAKTIEYDAFLEVVNIGNMSYKINRTSKRIDKIYDKATYFIEKNKKLEQVFGFKKDDNDDSYTFADGDVVYTFTSYVIVGDYLIAHDYNYDKKVDVRSRSALIEKGGKLILDPHHYDIEPLYNNYYAVSVDIIKDLQEIGLDLKLYDKNSYKKAIYNMNTPLTDEEYFVIKHVTGDLFHVYDGDSYHFIDVKTGEKVFENINLQGNYDFVKVGTTIIALNAVDSPNVMHYIHKGQIVKSVYATYSVNGGVVEEHFKSDTIHDLSYPVVVLKNKEAEKNINDRLGYQKMKMRKVNENNVYETLSHSFNIEPHHALIQLTTRVETYGFGAAHGMYSSVSNVFLPDKGEKIALKEWFKDNVDYQSILTSIFLKDVETSSQLFDYTADLSTEEAVKIFGLDKANYYFLEDALMIYYNPYEIAPFSAGIISFKIPLETIKEHFNDKANKLLLKK